MSADAKSVYDFTVKDKKGQPVALKSMIEGKVSLFVNTASQCGFTHQYKGLQELQDKLVMHPLATLGTVCYKFFTTNQRCLSLTLQIPREGFFSFSVPLQSVRRARARKQ